MKTRWLPVKLTESELLDRGRKMAEVVRERSRTELEKANAMKTYGETLKELNGEVSTLSRVISTGEEHREVEVYENKDYAEKTIKIFRADTHELVSSRSMDSSELQEEIPLVDAAKQVF